MIGKIELTMLVAAAKINQSSIVLSYDTSQIAGIGFVDSRLSSDTSQITGIGLVETRLSCDIH